MNASNNTEFSKFHLVSLLCTIWVLLRCWVPPLPDTVRPGGCSYYPIISYRRDGWSDPQHGTPLLFHHVVDRGSPTAEGPNTHEEWGQPESIRVTLVFGTNTFPPTLGASSHYTKYKCYRRRRGICALCIKLSNLIHKGTL